jgi:16S rRNA (uracil1498-N3)-methyltransferase
MTRRRWIADEVTNDRAALIGAHAAHLSRTLRAHVGQEFEVVCGDVVRRAIVASVNDERVEFELSDQIPLSRATPVTLLLAVFKFDRMEWAIEKCTELNATSLVPVIARRTEKHLALAAGKRVERWRRIAREAAEQARRMAPPEISDPLSLGHAVQATADLRIVLAETERQATLSQLLRFDEKLPSLALAIGPEGGWADEELQQFSRAGWLSASLGTTVLRSETAAIAALAIARTALS